MDIIIDKEIIIAAIKETDDERFLFAIKRLLQIDDDETPDWQKEMQNKNGTK